MVASRALAPDWVAALPDVVYVLRLEPDPGFEYVSDAVTALVGHTPEEHYADPGLGARIVDPRDAQLLAGLAGSPVGHPVEALLRWRSRDGRTVWTQHRCVKQRRDDGSVVLLGSAREVSEQVAEREESRAARLASEAAREEFRLLAENAADLVLRLDADDEVVWVSSSVHRLTGYEPAALMGRPRMDLVHPFDMAKVAAAMGDLRAGKALSVTEEVRIRHRDGSFTWWQATGRRTSDDPATSNIVLALRDIDEQVLARDRAALEHERRVAAVWSMLDPYLLLRAVRDRDGAVVDLTVVDANDAAATVLGAGPEAVVGARMTDLVPGLASTPLYREVVGVIGTGRSLVLDDAAFTGPTSGRASWVDVRAVRLGSDSVNLTWRDVTDRHAAVALLAESEERYRLLADHSGDVVVSTDPAGVLTYVSPAVTTVLGWAPRDLVGMAMRDLVHPDDLADVGAALQRMGASADRTASLRARVRRADGSYRWIASVARDVRTESGGQVAVVATWRDVQVEVEALQEVEGQRARLAAVLASELEPHVYLQAVRDEAGTIVDFVYADVNHAACEYMGVARQDLEGARVLELLPGQAGSGMLAMYAAAVESGEPLVLDDYAYPHELLAEERRYDIRAVRVGDGLSFAWRDVTERYETVRALAASEERFRSLVDGTATGLLVQDAEGRVLQANPAAEAMFGLTHDELLAWPPTGPQWRSTGRDGADLPVEQRPAAVTLATGRPVSDAVVSVHRPDGTVAWLNVSAVPIAMPGDGDAAAVVSSFVDVSAAVEAERRLAESEVRYRLLAENATDVVFSADADGVITFVSDGVTRITGWTPEEVVGRSVRDLVHPDDADALAAQGEDPATGTLGPVRIRVTTAGGEYRWAEATAHTVRDEDGTTTGRVGGWHDVTAEVAAEQALRRQAGTDALTGLLNRTEALTRLESVLAHPPRTGQRVGLLFCDLDSLKQVNDTRGHAAGDLLVVTTAARITAAVREDDLVARIGGDEILVVLVGVRDLDDAAAVAEKTRRAVAEPISSGEGRAPVASGISIGVTLAEPDDDVDSLIARADAAMYAAKHAGGDTVVAVPVGAAAPR